MSAVSALGMGLLSATRTTGERPTPPPNKPKATSMPPEAQPSLSSPKRPAGGLVPGSRGKFMPPTYNTITCRQCGQIFQAPSPRCRICFGCQRQKALLRKRARRALLREQRIGNPRRPLDDPRDQPMVSVPPSAEAFLATHSSQLQTCPRMHLTALSLPCGERIECFGRKRCSKVPRGMQAPDPKVSFCNVY